MLCQRTKIMKVFSVAVAIATLVLNAPAAFAQSISCAEGEGVATIYVVETAASVLRYEIAPERYGASLRATQKSCLQKGLVSTHAISGMPGVYASQKDAAFAFLAFARFAQINGLTAEAIVGYLPIAKSLAAERDAAIAKLEAAEKVAAAQQPKSADVLGAILGAEPKKK
jgi:hypothetical protein